MEKKHYIDMELVKKVDARKEYRRSDNGKLCRLDAKDVEKIFRRSSPKPFNGKLTFSIGKSLRCSDDAPDT